LIGWWHVYGGFADWLSIGSLEAFFYNDRSDDAI